MTLYDLKIVPDDRPNDDGRWVRQEVSHGQDVWDYVPEPGHHVVKCQRPRSMRDGGPMHATGYYPPGS